MRKIQSILGITIKIFCENYREKLAREQVCYKLKMITWKRYYHFLLPRKILMWVILVKITMSIITSVVSCKKFIVKLDSKNTISVMKSVPFMFHHYYRN